VWSWEYVSGITADFAIAITSDGTPVVAYADDSGLWWAQQDETWDRTRIVDGTFISAPDVVLDQNNVPHVKYQTETQVRYATIDANGTWQTWGVDSTSATSGGIAVDAGGVPHIAYYDPDELEFRQVQIPQVGAPSISVADVSRTVHAASRSIRHTPTPQRPHSRSAHLRS
jgi:hypothetical protein